MVPVALIALRVVIGLTEAAELSIGMTGLGRRRFTLAF
jgi:hypothetical protein